MSSRIIWRFWLPPILWTALILSTSNASFSAAHTSDWLATLINAIARHPIAPDWFEVLHAAMRKSAHLTGYGILSALLLRAFRADSGRKWDLRWALAAVAISAAVGALDEWHQLYVPGRSGSAYDVLIDTIGAALAQVLFFRT